MASPSKGSPSKVSPKRSSVPPTAPAATPTSLAAAAVLPPTPAGAFVDSALENAREEGQALSAEIADLQGQFAAEYAKNVDLKAQLPKAGTAKDAAERALQEAKRKRDQASSKYERLAAELRAKSDHQELQAKSAEAGLRAKEAVRDSVKIGDRSASLEKQVADARAELERAKETAAQSVEDLKSELDAKESEVAAEIEKRSKIVQEAGGAEAIAGKRKPKSAPSGKKKGVSAVVERAILQHRARREEALFGPKGLKGTLEERKGELADLKRDLHSVQTRLKQYAALDSQYAEAKQNAADGPSERARRKAEVHESLGKLRVELAGSADKEKADRERTEREKEEASAELESVKVQLEAARERGAGTDAIKAATEASVRAAQEDRDRAVVLAASIQEQVPAPAADKAAVRQKKLDERKRDQAARKKDLEKQVGDLKKELKKVQADSDKSKKEQKPPKGDSKKRKRSGAGAN